MLEMSTVTSVALAARLKVSSWGKALPCHPSFHSLPAHQCAIPCPLSSPHADLPTLSVVTHSFAKPVPEWFAEFQAAKKGAGAGSVNQKPQRAVVNEECPKCKNPSMEYYTMQLRSADEGQTVFYECTKCSHKFSVNT